jgi:hypothetical protein
MSGRRGSRRGRHNNNGNNRGNHSRNRNENNYNYQNENNYPPYNEYNAMLERAEYLAQRNGNNNYNNHRYNENKQRNRLIQLHKYHPHLNKTMAQELQDKYMKPSKLERFIEIREAAGIPYNTIFEEFDEGGVVTKGVGTGLVVMNPANQPYLLKKENAEASGLFNANQAINPGGAAAVAVNPWGGTRKRSARRKTRRNYRHRKTRRN